mmetsp:Transcript_53747/g.162570  ORF Transcript_53747/g.162570 Transcript_53747/m.162570 type:complete len:355 (-) Transcript_53747:42-1106(-)
MHVHRRDVHHVAVTCDGLATRLLHDEGHGSALVEEAQLAVLVLLVGGVGKDAAVEQRAVHVADHGANVTERVRCLCLALAVHDVGDVIPHRLIPLAHVGLVDRVDLPALRDLNAWPRELEVAHVQVKGEARDAVAKGHHELCGGGVEDVARRHEVLAGLQRLREAHELLVVQGVRVVLQNAVRLRVLLEDAKDRSYRHACVHVAAAIQRVEDANVVAALAHDLCVELVVEIVIHRTARDGRVLLLRGHGAQLARIPQSVLQHLVCDHVELLLVLALHVDAALQPQELCLLQRRLPHEARYDLCGLPNGIHDEVELSIHQTALLQLDHVPCKSDAGLLADIRELAHIEFLAFGRR